MDIFGKKKIKELEKSIEELIKKLHKKQEVINETNAYWKKKLHILKTKKNYSDIIH